VLLAALWAGLVDWSFYRLGGDLPSLVRAVILVTGLSLTGLIAYRLLLAPLAARADDLSLALRIEARYPALNDALASTVQFLQQPADSEARPCSAPCEWPRTVISTASSMSAACADPAWHWSSRWSPP
jgi:hypothetical protein